MRKITGIGWWTPEASGCLLSKREFRIVGQEVFSSQFNNFGRIDRDSRAAAFAVALALKDASLKYPLAPGTIAGICGCSPKGCLDADLAYFRDYVECGRTLGRGNYFIYTLPTSPLAECSIHFGLEGPVIYVSGETSRMASTIEAASEAMEDAQAALMIAGATMDQGAMFMVLAAESSDNRDGLDHKSVIEVLRKNGGQGILGAVESIQNLMRERGIKAAA